MADSSIDRLIADLEQHQAQLAQLIAAETDVEVLMKLYAIHGLNASRIGRLLRDRKVLSEGAANQAEDAMMAALDELNAAEPWAEKL